MRKRWRFRGWRLYWEPRDIWVGLYWKRSRRPLMPGWSDLYVWICLVPCVPLQLRWTLTPEGSA